MTTKHSFSRLHRATLATLGALSALAAAPAFAQDDGYAFFGIGVGQARARIDDDRIAQTLAGSGLSTNAVAHDERHSAYKVFTGYQFSRNWAVELGYFHLGKFGFNATTNPTGTLTGSFRVQGANLGVVGTLPFTENLSGLARVGVQYARTRANVVGTGAVVVADQRPSDREANAKVGLGLQYAFSPSFLMRAEVERFRVSDAVGNHPQVAMYSVSAVFPLGRAGSPGQRSAMMPMAMAMPMVESQPPVSAAAAPMPIPMPTPMPLPAAVEPTPPVPPVVSAQPTMPSAPPAPRRMSFEAESFFVFDRADVQPAGRLALDSLVQQLSGSNWGVITVQGYADRLGASDYNQSLSLARADAVKRYLVTTGRLDPSKIVTAGRGENSPVTLPDACKGPMSEPVIACLQPDRRVELEVSLTR